MQTFLMTYYWCDAMPSAFWCCWLGGRKGIWPVKNLSGGVLAWLSAWSEMQTYIWLSWCHCHSLSLASVKSRLVLPFWYQLTHVVTEKGPLNGCVCVRACMRACVLLMWFNVYMIKIQLKPNELYDTLLVLFCGCKWSSCLEVLSAAGGGWPKGEFDN